MSPEEFARFLQSLSLDTEEAGRFYKRLRDKKLVGFFEMKGVSDPVSAADEVIDRAAVKISGGANVPDVEKYCLGIARNVAKEKWREERRESSVFLLFVQNLAHDSADEVERIQRTLKPCFEELTEEAQKLLLNYCQGIHGRPRAEHRRQLAEAMNTTMLALRLRVKRLRDKLAECVRRRSENG